METAAGPRRIRDRRVRVSRWLRAVHQSLGTFALVGLVIAVAVGGTHPRLAYANWDAAGHLHPDERYISTVANDTSWPYPWGYFDGDGRRSRRCNIETGRSYVTGCCR